jgi:predicted deacylase
MPLAPPRRYHQLIGEMRALAEQEPRLQVEDVGLSVGGQSIVGCRLEGQGPTVMVIAGLHSMEHVGPCVGVELLRRAIGGKCEWPGSLLVVPVCNPDGYLEVEAGLSWRGGFWRHNRRGVDLNRNFAAGFAGVGSLARLWGADHRGSSALSEPETRAIHRLLARHRPVAFVSLHAFGNVIFTPRARSRRSGLLARRHRDVADKMAAASGYKTVPLGRYLPLFRAFGTELDHAHELGALSFLIEIGAGPRPLRPSTWWPVYRWYTPPDQLLIRDRDRAVAAVEVLATTTGSAAGR